MSDSRAAARPSSHANSARSLDGSRLARLVHGLSLAVSAVMSSALSGCVIPPSLDVDNLDARINSPPGILAVTSDRQALPEPGPVAFERGPGAGSLSISLIDTDVSDDLYVRIFVDYNLPDRLPARSVCTAAPNNNNAQRTATCDLSALCTLADVGIGMPRNMTIMVFDRPLFDVGEPPFQQPMAGGLSASRFYFLNCQEPQN
jgi:hypothetical protein